MVAATEKIQLGFGFGSTIELHLLLIGDQRWFCLDKSGQHRLPYRSLVAKVVFFDVDDYRYDRASLTLSDGKSMICFASSSITTQIYQAIAMSAAKTGDIIEINLDALGVSLVQKF